MKTEKSSLVKRNRIEKPSSRKRNWMKSVLGLDILFESPFATLHVFRISTVQKELQCLNLKILWRCKKSSICYDLSGFCWRLNKSMGLPIALQVRKRTKGVGTRSVSLFRWTGRTICSGLSGNLSGSVCTHIYIVHT
jgi:hypothetical protein